MSDAAWAHAVGSSVPLWCTMRNLAILSVFVLVLPLAGGASLLQTSVSVGPAVADAGATAPVAPLAAPLAVPLAVPQPSAGNLAAAGLGSTSAALTVAPAASLAVVLASVRASLDDHDGFLTAVPTPDGVTILTVFSGTAPAALPAVPAPWRIAAIGDQSPARLRIPVEDAFTDLTGIEWLQDPAADPATRAAGIVERFGNKVPTDPDVSVPAAGPSTGIGPGSLMLVTIPGDGTYLCTAAFVMKSGAKYYLSTAGHCVLPESTKATHGPGADYNADGVRVRVCVAQCFVGGELSGILWNSVTLGNVAYARQTGTGGDIGNDFGLVEIPSSQYGLIRADMPLWGGPASQHSGSTTLSPVVHFGNGIDSGTTFATQGRAGLGLGNDASSWDAAISINGGDSGSAISVAKASTAGLTGDGALGVVTHGIVTGGVPLGWGTLLAKGKSMAASDAGISLTLVTA